MVDHCPLGLIDSVDIIHLICSQLAEDLRSIYSLALSSHLYSSVALPALYSHLSKFPADYDDEDRLAEDPTAYTTRLTKWSSLWKTLAHSAITPRKTTINYAAALRVLNLRDLCSLMEEFGKYVGQTARTKFFEDGLEEYNKTRLLSVGKRNNSIFDWQNATDCLTDLIVKETKNVTILIRQTTLPDHLHLWLQNTPSLEALQLFSGSTLGDERVVEALTGCPNLRSLELYYWQPSGSSEDLDALFARFLRSMVVGLRRLVIKNCRPCFGELALSALAHYHGNTLTELEANDLQSDCFYSLSLASNITNLRSCVLYVDEMVRFAEPEDKFAVVSEFFARNTSLETLSVGIVATSRILGTALPNLHLKHLTITDTVDEVIPDTFWPAISSQANSLETLILDSKDHFLEMKLVPEEMLKAICLLHKLKVLAISAFFPLIRDEEVGRITDNCPDIEEFLVASPALSDFTLQHLSKLKRLRTFNTRLVSISFH